MKNLIYQLSIINCQFRRGAAFTLVELMIVVAILGILAAIVLPEFQNQSQFAKESAAKANLKILREAVERYALDHNGVPPGYFNNDATKTPTGLVTKFQLEAGYVKIPKNPFNNLNTVFAVSNATTFPAAPNNSYGWLYKPSTKEIRLNTSGTDSKGISYFSY